MDADTQDNQLGSEIRQLRRARKLTLNELSAQAGISLSHLSAIERGASSPSIKVLGKIAAQLGVAPDWLFAQRAGVGPMERAHVVRAANRRELNPLYGQTEQELGYRDSLLSASVGGQFYMGLAVYAPQSDGATPSPHRHPGEQHGLVLEGQLELRIGDEVTVLHAGDSYSFPADIPHNVVNRSNQIARLVWAASPVVIPKDVAT